MSEGAGSGPVEAAPGVFSREVGGETVILDSSGDRYFGLNETGAITWRHLTSGGTIAQAAEEVARRFAVDRAQALQDAEVLVRSLLDKGLLRPAGG
jgi:hypothetical protein